ncbi:MAG TPA: response regulator, partial [Polyangiaceae bacterium]
HLGHQVDVLNGGASAIETIDRAAASERGGYDLLLLDVMLNEDLDGLELLERIRTTHPEQLAVMVSGQAERIRETRGSVRSVTWLAKPYTAESLADAVEALLAVHGFGAGRPSAPGALRPRRAR